MIENFMALEVSRQCRLVLLVKTNYLWEALEREDVKFMANVLVLGTKQWGGVSLLLLPVSRRFAI
jgi:hypothetical protein